MRFKLPALLALLGPLLVAALTLVGLEALRYQHNERAKRNVGRVFNGRLYTSTTVEAYIQEQLEAHPPEIILLGNSLSNTNLRLPLLAGRLRVPRDHIHPITIPNSLGPHWYAILKNRVYAQGHRPKVVIVLSDMQSLLATRPRSELSWLNLKAQLGRKEPVIDRKVVRGAWWWERLREDRAAVRDESLQAVRNLALNLVWYQSLSTEAQEEANAALQAVFADANTDLALHQAAIPVFEQGRPHELHAWDPNELPAPKDSFLPDIARLVAEHNGTVVFIRPPLSPLVPTGAGDVVPPALERRAVQMAERLGGIYLDMSQFPMTTVDFYNLEHMTPRGAHRFTAAVAHTLVAAGVLGGRKRTDARAELLSGLTVVDGRAIVERPPVRFLSEPPDLEVPALTEVNGQLFFEAPDLAGLSDSATQKHTPFHARCSPVQVLENGHPLPMHGVACQAVETLGRGRACHSRAGLKFAASRSSPLRTPRFSVRLDPERSCEGALWLYPGDTVELSWPEAVLQRLPADATRLRVEAREMVAGGDEGSVHFALTSADEVVLTDTLSLRHVRNGRRSWPLARPIPLTERPVLRVENRSESYLLVTGVALAAQR